MSTPSTASSTVVQRATIQGYGGTAPGAEIESRFNSPRARALGALNAVGLWWGAAVAAAFIPVAHLLLVPGFVVFGLVMAIRRARARQVVTRLSGTCPDCGHVQDFEAPDGWPSRTAVTCRRCRRALRVVPVAERAEPVSPTGA